MWPPCNVARACSLLVAASSAGTTDTDIRTYADPFSIGSAAPGQEIQPVGQTFAFPGYLGGTSIAAADINGDAFPSYS